ncbi:hypothetical protein ACFXO9_31195 [Nocardia tengchongensis]|uniref:hypothetical protein n=1 Tax=Nocardia tengchongensis TaxID=2055889 RepID=UPI00367F1E8C
MNLLSAAPQMFCQLHQEIEGIRELGEQVQIATRTLTRCEWPKVPVNDDRRGVGVGSSPENGR